MVTERGANPHSPQAQMTATLEQFAESSVCVVWCGPLSVRDAPLA